MIKMTAEGRYKLIETRNQTKILSLEKRNTYAWVNARNIGEILVTTHRKHPFDTILCTSNYRIYEVKTEPKFSDGLHLELNVGNGFWQGYLLPSGFPNEKKIRNRIIPRKEIISKSKKFSMSA